MSIFNLHSSVLDDYRNFVGSYFTIADERAREFVERALSDQDIELQLTTYPDVFGRLAIPPR